MSATGLYDDDAVSSNISALAAALVNSNVFTTSNAFFSTAPTQYVQYYLQVVRKCQQFYDGYVPILHGSMGNGILSTHLGSMICSSLASKVCGGNIGFVCGNGSNDYSTASWVAHRWANKSGFSFNDFARQAIEWAYAFGTSLIKLNRDIDGEYFPTSNRLDDFTFALDGRMRMVDCKSLVEAYSSVEGKKPGEEGSGDTYFLLEHRFFKDGTQWVPWRALDGKRYLFRVGGRVPYAEYEVAKVSASEGTQQHIMATATIVDYKSLPGAVRDCINQNYPSVIVGKECMLPFRDSLGAWPMNANGFNGNAPNMPFGKSILDNILVELAEYDIYSSFSDIDVNNGKGTVYTPKSQDMDDLVGATIINSAGVEQKAVRMQNPYTRRPENVQYLDGDPDKERAFANQFDLRADEWAKLKDHTLKEIAMKIGVKPEFVFPYLSEFQPVEGKSQDVPSNDQASVDWTLTQRDIFARPLNEMIECLLSLEGRSGNVRVKFGNVGLRSREKVLDYCAQSVKNGFMTSEMAIRELNPELDEEQIQGIVAKCKNEHDQKIRDDMLRANNQDVDNKEIDQQKAQEEKEKPKPARNEFDDIASEKGSGKGQ